MIDGGVYTYRFCMENMFVYINGLPVGMNFTIQEIQTVSIDILVCQTRPQSATCIYFM